MQARAAFGAAPFPHLAGADKAAAKDPRRKADLPATTPEVMLVGSNPTRLWGLGMDERVRRIARAQKLPFGEGSGNGPALLVNLAFVFDPAWLRYFSGRPGEALTREGQVVLAYCRDGAEQAAVRAAIEAGGEPAGTGLTLTAHESGATAVNTELRKREQPFAMRLEPASVRAAERASYYGAYKGVTDVLTKYLWPEWALVLTRLAARAGISPNMVTTVGAILCVAATILFWYGHYWLGLALGLVFMVLDTVDGKLARCTITSSKWGNVFDHGIDLVHPPFWWYAWGVGLGAWGLAVHPSEFNLLMAVIVGGYVVQRLIEGAFMRFYGMHIHVWRRFDSDFRLITARRNPNMVILFVSLIFQRPDIGLEAVAGWTVLSCAVHLVRLIQAMVVSARGTPIRSWLD
jgi:phosphatidylglycerophosphate synthase